VVARDIQSISLLVRQLLQGRAVQIAMGVVIQWNTTIKNDY